MGLWLNTILGKVCLPWFVSVTGNSESSGKSFTAILWQTWQSCWLTNTSYSEPSVRSQLSGGQCENWYVSAVFRWNFWECSSENSQGGECKPSLDSHGVLLFPVFNMFLSLNSFLILSLNYGGAHGQVWILSRICI